MNQAFVAGKWPALIAALGIGAFFAQRESTAVDKAPAKKPAPPNKLDLMPETMLKLFALVQLQETEWRNLRIQWMTDIAAAQKLTAKEDRPIVVLYTGGASFRDRSHYGTEALGTFTRKGVHGW